MTSANNLSSGCFNMWRKPNVIGALGQKMDKMQNFPQSEWTIMTPELKKTEQSSFQSSSFASSAGWEMIIWFRICLAETLWLTEELTDLNFFYSKLWWAIASTLCHISKAKHNSLPACFFQQTANYNQEEIMFFAGVCGLWRTMSVQIVSTEGDVITFYYCSCCYCC